MTLQQRDNAAQSPRIHVAFLDREYSGPLGAKSYEVVSTLTNIFDSWTVDLPIGPDGINEDIPKLDIHRWKPIVLSMSDPLVENGKPVPMVMGVCTKVEHHTSGDQPSVLRLSGYDLGKLLDSCVNPFIRFRGLRLIDLVNKLLDPSWLRKEGPVTDEFMLWGIQGVRGLNVDRTLKLGRKITGGRQGALLDQQPQIGAIMPPMQTEVGETVYDVLSRYARLTGITNNTGQFISVSADGWIQLFNPNDYANDEPLYSFDDTDDPRNTRIERSSLILEGDDLYTDYRCYGSVIIPPQALQVNRAVDFNAGRFYGATKHSPILGTDKKQLNRLLTFADAEQYRKGFAQARAEWRRKQSLYKEVGIRLTIQGHSMPSPKGEWLPVVDGNMAEIFSTRLNRYGRFIIEQTIKRQSVDIGTQTDVVLRLPGLLGP